DVAKLLRTSGLLLRPRYPQLIARLESVNLDGRNIDGLAGGRIDALAGSPLAHLEGAKAHERDLFGVGQRVRNGLEYRLEGVVCGLLRQAGTFSHSIDKFGLVQEVDLLA